MGEIIKKAVRGNVSFWICLGISAFLIVGGCLYPPPFYIESSIFVGTGELFAFAALGAFLKALDKGVDAKITKGDTQVRIENPDGEDNQHKHHRDDDDIQMG